MSTVISGRSTEDLSRPLQSALHIKQSNQPPEMEDSSMQYHNVTAHITEYERERDERKKALHDAVHRTLIAAGFPEAASLRYAFSGENSATVAAEELPAKRSRRRKTIATSHSLLLRRTSGRVREAQQKCRSTANASAAPKAVVESFCTWTPKKTQKEMKAKAAASKRKQSESSEKDVDASEEEDEVHSPGPQNLNDKGALVSHQFHARLSEEAPDLADQRRIQCSEGAPRPQHGGYRGTELGRRPPMEWDDEFRRPYGSHSSAPYGGSFRRPWSPNPYEGTRDFDNRGMSIVDRGRQYEGRPDYVDRREMFYEGRGRDFDMREPQVDERRHYNDGRYDRRPAVAPDSYGRGIPPSPASATYGRSSRVASSPPPSSSGNATDSAKRESEGRRPLYLNKLGVPTGRMATMLQADIVSFAKDMDPTQGWERQTTAHKDRLRERLLHDYEFYGESTRLSERFLKKKVGAALTQFRYSMNQLIDRGADRPADFNPIYWDELVRRRSSAEAKEKSEQMANIARGRSSRNSTKKALEQTVIVQLAKDLKREPLDVEIQEAVDREWAAMQEEVADRKRLRATTAVSKAALESNKDLEKRVLVVEAFMQKWEPEMEVWKGLFLNSSSKKVSNAAAVKARTVEDFLNIPSTEKPVEQQAKQVPEEKVSDSSDDEGGSEESKSSGDEGTQSESEDGKESSGDDVQEVRHVPPRTTVEAVTEAVSLSKSKKNSGVPISSASAGKATAGDAVKFSSLVPTGSKSSAQTDLKSVEQGVGDLGKGPDRGSIEVLSNEKEDVGIATRKDADKEPRLRKRQKVAATSTQQATPVTEEATTKVVHIMPEAPKMSKNPKRNAKTGNTQMERKGGKKAK